MGGLLQPDVATTLCLGMYLWPHSTQQQAFREVVPSGSIEQAPNAEL